MGGHKPLDQKETSEILLTRARDGLAGESSYTQSPGPDVYPQELPEERNELAPTGCPLTFACTLQHLSMNVSPQVHGHTQARTRAYSYTP